MRTIILVGMLIYGALLAPREVRGQVGGEPRGHVLNVKIKEPDGLPVQGVAAGDTVFRFNPSCFEWQYVHPNNVVVSYSQIIEGLVEPNSSPFGYFWSVSAGALSGADTATPVFDASGMSVPSLPWPRSR